MIELFPRLTEHYQKSISYYEKQAAQARIDLARVCLVYAGQIEIDYSHIEPRTPTFEQRDEGLVLRQYLNHFEGTGKV